MANQNAPFGLRAVRRYDGMCDNFAIQEIPIAYNNTNVIYQGDPVILLANGTIDKALVGSTRLKGVMDGVSYYDTLQQKKIFTPGWLAPSTALAGSVMAKVIVDSMAVYEIQSSGVNIDQTAVGANATFVAASATTANAMTQISNASLDQTSLNTTNTLPFRIVGLSPLGGNDNTGSYNIVEVIIVNNEITSTTGL